MGGIALTAFLAEEAQAATAASPSGERPIRPLIDPAAPYAPWPPHFEPKAKNVVLIFCSGALSHVDTFDYKPELIRRHDTPMPVDGDKLITFQGEQGNLMKPQWEFPPRSESGTMTSDLLPKLGELADEMCFIHAMAAKSNPHGPAEKRDGACGQARLAWGSSRHRPSLSPGVTSCKPCFSLPVPASHASMC